MFGKAEDSGEAVEESEVDDGGRGTLLKATGLGLAGKCQRQRRGDSGGLW